MPHMGRLPILNASPDHPDPKRPPESNEDGCPGAWYRNDWTSSVSHYERMRTEYGFSENLHLSRSDDRLLLDAVAYLEGQRVLAHNEDDRKRAQHMRQKNGA